MAQLSSERLKYTEQFARSRPAVALEGTGVVVIGRNEGERLRRCLLGVADRGLVVVYVDSGSDDGSVALARSLGAEVVALDPAIPFTAARARNEGTRRLLEVQPTARFVQFVDGDCEIIKGWLERAVAELERHPDEAVVCGRLRERTPERSIYNRLADIEWERPTGELKACGGIALMRIVAFVEAGGFNGEVFAGEEGELCLRLRRRGWRIVGIDAAMALHDIDMTRFGQWWRRAQRAGRAYALGCFMHGASDDRHCVREAASIAFWGAVLPLFVLATAWWSSGASLMLLAGYPFLYFRTVHRAESAGMPRGFAKLYARFCILAKFPQLAGLTSCTIAQLADRWRVRVEP